MMTLRRRVKYLLHNWCPGFAGRFSYYGTTVHFPPGAPLFREICERGSFEPAVIARLEHLAAEGTTVFDVGANIGLMAIPVLRRRATCRVVSFEPSPNSLPYLQRTARGAGFGERWLVVGKAVAAAVGALDFAVGHPSDALFEGLGSAGRIADARIIQVPATTVDEEWAALGRPPVSVLKIDVEGAEGLVLEGARRMVEACRPAILLEWADAYLAHFGTKADALLSWSQEWGYRLYSVPAGTPVTDPQLLAVQMLNCQNFLLLSSQDLAMPLKMKGTP